MVNSALLIDTSRVEPSGLRTRSSRVRPTVEGPSAWVTPADPSAAMIASTVRRSEALVPMAMISVPRSMPALSAGAPSNASATNTRRAVLSVDRRMPKPALEPDWKKAFSSAIEVM
jgi:hypothetical protein